MYRLPVLSRRVSLSLSFSFQEQCGLVRQHRMKALIFTLIRNFEFEPALPEGEIVKRSSIVQRPYIRGQVEKGAQLPLLVKPYARA